MLECLVLSLRDNEAPADSREYNDYLDRMTSVWFEMRRDANLTYVEVMPNNTNTVVSRQLREWINENIKGYCWSFDDNLCDGLLFEHAKEAMYFKLKWG